MRISDLKLPWRDWTVVGRLGSGSYGTVFEIERVHYNERSAVKVITIPPDQDQLDSDYSDGLSEETIHQKYADQRARIEREYRLMAEMKSHPNIVRCEDIVTEPVEDGIGWNIYIRMELLQPLHKYLRDHTLEPEDVRQLGMDLCEALHACQKKGIIHRDIKPENILLSEFGSFKLGDFGVARTMDHTTAATFAGTERYMAPEVWEHRSYNHTVDIYSLGLVMYWLLNERRIPFLSPDREPSAPEIQYAITRRLNGEPLPAPRGGSDRLKAIVLKACAHQPNDRWQSAEEMLEALRAAGSEKAAQTVPDPFVAAGAAAAAGSVGSYTSGSANKGPVTGGSASAAGAVPPRDYRDPEDRTVYAFHEEAPADEPEETLSVAGFYAAGGAAPDPSENTAYAGAFRSFGDSASPKSGNDGADAAAADSAAAGSTSTRTDDDVTEMGWGASPDADTSSDETYVAGAGAAGAADQSQFDYDAVSSAWSAYTAAKEAEAGASAGSTASGTSGTGSSAHAYEGAPENKGPATPPTPPDDNKRKLRKIGLVVLGALLMLFLLRTFVHSYSEPTCTEPATCRFCGKTKGEPLGHDWQEADCYNPEICSRCHATRGDVLDHDWAAADCTNPETCKRCGLTRGEPLGHDWGDADCTKPATCKRCGETAGSAIGHDWADATCTKPKTCKRCGETTGDALGHDWAKATYDKPKTCKRCGETTGNVKGYVSGSDLSKGKWSETAVTLQDYNNYPWILNSPLKKCRKIKIGLKVTEMSSGYSGSWGFYVRSNGQWSEAGRLEVKEANKEYVQTYTFSPSKDIDAFMFEPLYRKGQGNWRNTLYFYEAQVD